VLSLRHTSYGFQGSAKFRLPIGKFRSPFERPRHNLMPVATHLVDAYRIELGMRRGDLGRLLGGKTHMAARRAAGIPNDVLTGTTPIDDEDQEQYWRT
jgi:hypothetical protein